MAGRSIANPHLSSSENSGTTIIFHLSIYCVMSFFGVPSDLVEDFKARLFFLHHVASFARVPSPKRKAVMDYLPR